MTDTRQFVSPPHTPTKAAWLCMECSRDGKTCCRTNYSLSSLCFPLSVAEWRRLTPYAGLAVSLTPDDGAAFLKAEAAADAAALLAPPESNEMDAMPAPNDPEDRRTPPDEGDAVCTRVPNVPEFINSIYELFPGGRQRLEALFPADGEHWTLRIRLDGSCVFLGAEGCRLPRTVRPWYCRLYPAWVMKDGLTMFLSTGCLISQQAKGPADCLRILGVSLKQVCALYERLGADWGLA
jgi:Fe-S-cluster containining protein